MNSDIPHWMAAGCALTLIASQQGREHTYTFQRNNVARTTLHFCLQALQ